MLPYCHSRSATVRWRTREVFVGAVGIGGSNPIRIQSMTTTDTLDIEGTVRQTIALAEAGCEIVRITAPSTKAAAALGEIKARLLAAKVFVPLVADIHFTPKAALEAANHVEKVRVNPGNYADVKKFKVREYSDAQYESELQRLYDAFSPLVLRCRELGRAMRIGTNHGSLSDRILNRYGDTPAGMVESALEFVRIAESHSYRDLILSLKASNPKVMMEAYRLAAARMRAAGLAYPLHLGVTEAGEGEDARIKSTIGIGALLYDGLGDTIRVSLTEDSVYEIPVARDLARRAMALWARQPDGSLLFQDEIGPGSPAHLQPWTDSLDPFSFTRRPVEPVSLGPSCALATTEPPRVILASRHTLADPAAIGLDLALVQARLREARPEGLLVPVPSASALAHLPDLAARLGPSGPALFLDLSFLPLAAISSLPWPEAALLPAAPRLGLLVSAHAADPAELASFLSFCLRREALPILDLLPADLAGAAGDTLAATSQPALLTCSRPEPASHPLGTWRRLAESARARALRHPLWIRHTHAQTILTPVTFADRLMEGSLLAGPLLCDGLGDALSLETVDDPVRAVALAYNILQGARARVSKTEFVACPSCGRTLFDLQSTTLRIKDRTGHLKGVTIAIMGCIVNGPGEMADADFGYVGGAPGKVNLYVGKTPVKYNVPEAEAVDRLVDLIREHGKWVEPPALAPTT